MDATEQPASLSERARDQDPEVRYRAVTEMHGVRDLASLLEALSDESWRVRRAAVEVLAMGAEPARSIPGLIEKLSSPDNAGARNAAAEALARIGAPAVPALAERLRDPDEDLRKFAADVLGEIRDRDALVPLVAALADADRNVRVSAAEALGKIGGPEAAGALEAALTAGDGLLRLAILDALFRLDCSPPLGVLAPLFADRYLRRSVLRLLGTLSGRPALELIAEGLKDPSRGTREAAFEALASHFRRDGEQGAPIIAQTLRQALRAPGAVAEIAREGLQSQSPVVSEGALRVLGIVGVPADALAVVRAGVDDAVRDVALWAAALLGPPAGPVLLKALSDLLPEERMVAIAALARLHERAAVPALAALTCEGNEAESLAAIEALGALGDPSAVEPLTDLFDEPMLAPAAARALGALGRVDRAAVQAAVRERLAGPSAPWAIRVLGLVGGRADLCHLKAALDSERTEVRLAATEAALAMGLPAAAETLRIALADEAWEVRAGAARGLGRFPSAESLAALVGALEDREPSVAAAAAQALGDVGDAKAAEPLSRMLNRGREHPGTPEVLPAIAAVRSLARLGAAAPEALLCATTHPDPEVVKEAVEIAATLPGAERALLVAARHERWDVRQAAARAVAARGDRSLLEELRQLTAAETDTFAREAFEGAVAALEARPPAKG